MIYMEVYIINIVRRAKYIKKELKESYDLLSNINGYSLDNEQRKAVIDNSDACLIVAGAGSGKSLTMVGKIRYLIERKGIKEAEILCVSFTREASLNLEKNIKKNYNYNLPVYTFHKLSLNILRDKNYKISKSDTLIYIVDEYFHMIKYNKEMKNRVKRLLFKIDTSYDKVLNSNEMVNLKRLILTFINLFKTNNYKLNDFINFKGNKDLIRIIIDIYILYEEELKSKNEIDFNDMIVKAAEYVKYNNINNYKYNRVTYIDYLHTLFLLAYLFFYAKLIFYKSVFYFSL